MKLIKLFELFKLLSHAKNHFFFKKKKHTQKICSCVGQWVCECWCLCGCVVQGVGVWTRGCVGVWVFFFSCMFFLQFVYFSFFLLLKSSKNKLSKTSGGVFSF